MKCAVLSVSLVYVTMTFSKETYKAKEEVRVAASYVYLFETRQFAQTLPNSSGSAKLPASAYGGVLYWGYIVSAYTVFGVNMGYRMAPGYNEYSQFIAGLQSRIYFTAAKSIPVRPYVTYGFQAITTFLKMRDRDYQPLSGTGQHRTMHLGLGMDLFRDFYFELVYVYSRFSLFGLSENMNFDHANADFGYRFEF